MTTPLTINPKRISLEATTQRLLDIPRQQLSNGAKWVLLQLLCIGISGNGDVAPSREDIAVKCGGISVRQVGRRLRELVGAGLITIHRRGCQQNNAYTFPVHEVFVKE